MVSHEPDDLSGYVTELGLDDHHEYLLSVARPSIEIITVEAPITKGCSKFGGSPDLPPAFSWPHHERGPYRFIGQVNLAAIPKGPHGLPDGGLLVFFCAHDEDGESSWWEPGYVRAYLFDTVEALQSVEPPAAVRLGSTSTLAFHLGADVPPWPCSDSDAKQWPIRESQRDAYRDLRCRLHHSGRYLLGYPFTTTLAYDPTPGPEWCSLLTLSSDDEVDWCWHDGDWLVTFIEAQRMRAGDFSQVKADAG